MGNMDASQLALDERRTSGMETNLYQIIYASIATRPMKEDELVQLLELAREKNKRLGITGMLLHCCDGSFLQVLEGPKERVLELLRVIRQDSRHKKVSVLFEGPIQHRSFSQWSMGFKKPSQEELDKLDGYTPYLELGDDPKAIKNYSGVALKMVRAFREICEK